MPATPTLESYLRSPAPASIRKGNTASSAADSSIPAKKAQPTPSSSKKRKGKATTTPKSGSKKRKKARAPFVPDNRDLGTLDLLSDSSDDDGDLEVVQPALTPTTGRHEPLGKPVMLEEEDWLRDDDDAVMEMGEGASGTADDVAAADGPGGSTTQRAAVGEPALLDDGPEGTANLLAARTRLADPAEQDPLDGCQDAEACGDTPAPARATAGSTGCECGSDDEVLVLDEGPTCPGCKLLLDTLPKKVRFFPPRSRGQRSQKLTQSLVRAQKRDSHVESCLASSASTDATPSNFGASTSTSGPSRGLLAPLSRLFSRAPPDTTSTANSPAPDTKGKGKAPVSLLSSLPNAFTALMAGHTETKQWKAAEEADKQKGRRPKGEEKKVPFYKCVRSATDCFRRSV